ncbi:hypothetical protein LCGC14_1396030 [marine sediment metagenome]|uniref:Uncharacterized protein n=1 Tax=marine sediment metagenome TaxID=412755 RepID=A0A0F9ME39_9ZZZZ
MEIIKCIVKGMELHPEDDKIHRFCAKIEDGTAVKMKLSVWESGRSENASRYFHKLRDRYAGAMGYTREYAKAELKHDWGVWLQYDEDFETPKWAGKFVEIFTVIVFMKSTAEYTMKEMNLLIEGTIKSCIDNSIDIEDLIKEREATHG